MTWTAHCATGSLKWKKWIEKLCLNTGYIYLLSLLEYWFFTTITIYTMSFLTFKTVTGDTVVSSARDDAKAAAKVKALQGNVIVLLLSVEPTRQWRCGSGYSQESIAGTFN